MKNITFDFDGKKYQCSQEAYDLDRIILPDGRLLEVEGWQESNPPRPSELQEVQHVFSSKTPDEIAQAMNGVVAEEIEQ